jgi:hypothetical protein
MLHAVFLSDTHLGLDLPLRPRVTRRWRGEDFFANTERALAPALAGGIDLVIHAGDLFHKSDVALGVVERLRPAKSRGGGGPVVVVPQSRAFALAVPAAAAPSLHPRARSATQRNARGPTDARRHRGLSYHRHGIARSFPGRRQHGAFASRVDIRLLCLHQCIEGARVDRSTTL